MNVSAVKFTKFAQFFKWLLNRCCQSNLAFATKIHLHGDFPSDRAIVSHHTVKDSGRDHVFDVKGAGIARVGKREIDARFEFLDVLHSAVLSCLHDFGNGKGHNDKAHKSRSEISTGGAWSQPKSRDRARRIASANRAAGAAARTMAPRSRAPRPMVQQKRRYTKYRSLDVFSPISENRRKGKTVKWRF